MHLFVISVRVLFNANLIKGGILVIAPLLSSYFAFPFGPQPKLILPFSKLQATPANIDNTHTHTHTRTHAHALSLPLPLSLSERTRDWPA